MKKVFIYFLIIIKSDKMDIEQSIDELKRWTEAKIHDLKKFVKKFGDIDLSLKCNFSSSAKKAYIEILIMLDDKVKYLAD